MRLVAHLIDAKTPADMLWQMLAVRNDGELVFSLGPAPLSSPPCPGEVEVVHRSIGPACLSVARLARKLPPGTILHVWSADLLKIAILAAKYVGGKVVLSIPHLPDNSDALADIPWMVGQLGCTLTVPTNQAKTLLLSARTDPQRLALLRPAADVAEYSTNTKAKRETVRQSLGISDDAALMVVPGEMVRYGGHKLASWSHAILRNMNKPVEMLFPWHGPQEKSVRFFAETTSFINEVHFTGNEFSRSEIFAAGDGAMFFYQRDRGITSLAHAMAAGLPILAGATPDLAEICTHGQTALLAKLGDPRTASAVLMQLLDDADLANQLGDAGRKLAEKEFHPTVIRKQLDEIYTTAKPI